MTFGRVCSWEKVRCLALAAVMKLLTRAMTIVLYPSCLQADKGFRAHRFAMPNSLFSDQAWEEARAAQQPRAVSGSSRPNDKATLDYRVVKLAPFVRFSRLVAQGATISR